MPMTRRIGGSAGSPKGSRTELDTVRVDHPLGHITFFLPQTPPPTPDGTLCVDGVDTAGLIAGDTVNPGDGLDKL